MADLRAKLWSRPTGWPSTSTTPGRARSSTPSWYLPTQRRDPRAEYAAAHIPGAVYLRHRRHRRRRHAAAAHAAEPGEVQLARAQAGPRRRRADRRLRRQQLHRLGPRLVDVPAVRPCRRGGARWRPGQVAGRGPPGRRPPVRPVERHFTARQNNLLVRDLEQMRANLTRRRRAGGRRPCRRAGSTPPSPSRGPGCARGHIPGSLNLPYADLVAADGTLKPQPTLRAAVRRGGRRSGPADRHHLRLGRLGRGAEPGPVHARRAWRRRL